MADELLDASLADIERSEKIDPFDVAETDSSFYHIHIPIAPLARSIGGGLSISSLLPLFLMPTMSMIFEE